MGVIEERYQKIVDDWQRQKITTAAELKAALAGREITIAYGIEAVLACIHPVTVISHLNQQHPA